METSFNIGAVSSLANNPVTPLPQTNTISNNEPSEGAVSLQAIDTVSTVAHAIGSVSSVLFTLENDKILNLKSLGKDINSREKMSIKETFNASTLSMKNVSAGAIDGAKHGFLVDGALSVLVNSYKVLTGKESGTEAVSFVAADVVSGTLSGAGGAMAGGLTALGLGVAGVTGLPGVILIGGAALVGTLGTSMLTQKTGLYDSIKNNVASLMTSHNKA